MKRKSLYGVTALSLGVILAACGDEEAGNDNTPNDNDPANNNNVANNDADNNAEANADDDAEETDYPENDIDIIVPYSAGGGGDTVARIISDELSDELGVSINVINQEGAGGEIGISEMANADSDGYTLGVFGYPDNLVLENTADTDFDFDSFEYLAAFDDVPHALFASPSAEFETMDELTEYAEENPGELTFGESGALGLLKILAYEDEAGVDVSAVNYEGGGDLINDLLGDHIDVASSSITSAPEITDAGGTPLGYAAEERVEMFDDYPTHLEQDYDLEMGVSRVLVAPDGVPDDVVNALSDALDTIGESEDFAQQFEEANLPYRYMGHEEVNDYLENANETLQPIIDENEDDFGGE
ncbi:Tripartite-type tricarboxylate transporter, receptor component TctC [Salisediminibacterium halotolerans]|uniref:Tripartite-type tricarboxylate transporter, receptor component TctC n=2 Tax=Salisediminibacterium halotolerans TaxID=517425 RepID=A0A1H9WD91_9BACI|nr:Tripartite-type tricarboxylate transporter, receptor component TctC [Salisediminibacterium haloalkalitolerans]